MTRHRDDASPVRAAQFDRATHTLRVEFTSGAEYDYADVPEHLYDELARSRNPDEFFRENIRDEFIGTRADDVDLARMAKERREDALLGAPLAEQGLGGGHDRITADRCSQRAQPSAVHSAASCAGRADRGDGLTPRPSSTRCRATVPNGHRCRCRRSPGATRPPWWIRQRYEQRVARRPGSRVSDPVAHPASGTHHVVGLAGTGPRR